MSDFEHRGSGWTYLATNLLHVGINQFEIVRGSRFIKLPDWIRRKPNAVINIVNFDDDNCFIYCILAHLYPANSKFERPESYPQNFHDHLNLGKLQMPMKLLDIKSFEALNPSISINVFGVEGTKIIGPLYHTSQKKENHINLLFLQSGENSHYCLIKDLSRLIGSAISKHDGKKFICDSCLNHFNSKEKYDLHQKDCSLFKPVQITMPQEEDAYLQFSSHKALLRKPFIIVADYEALTTPIKESSPTINSSYLYEEHKPIAVGYSLICSFDNKYNTYVSHCSESPEVWFVDQMKSLCQKLYNILLFEDKPMHRLTIEQQNEHDSLTKCPLCDCQFTLANQKVHHHDHYTGLYQFGCCNSCNLKIQKDFVIPVFFHNLSRYDAHLFIRELSRHASVGVIPTNTETYISFSAWFGHIRLTFLDSFRFLPESLAALVSNLDTNQLTITKSHFPAQNEFDLLTRKGVYPYDYMDSFEKMLETRLPEKSKFFNQLTFSHISDDDYDHAQTVWNVFKCKNLQDYTMLYLKTDVLLLCDVIENFRDLTFRYYGLDAAGFYTSPGLSFAAALKLTKIRLNLFTDVNMYNFITNAIRGGLTNSMKKYARANNRFMKDFDPEKEVSYIHYLDFVNLYGHCLMQPLPVGDFRWLQDKEIDRVNSMLLSGYNNYKQYFNLQQDKSIILEVDLDYPTHLHDLHNQMPFCAEHIVPEKCTQAKLMCTLNSKERYVIHLKNLVQCLEQGLKLTKIHRVLEFTELAWLKPYIELNTKLRAASKNEFEKNFFKLLINAIFGKTIENDRKKRELKLVNNWNFARKLILKPNFLRSTIIDEDFVIIELKKTEILVNKPVFCGFSVLEFAKWKMYDFYYNYVIKNLSGSFKIDLLYEDTDSQIFHFTLKENTDKNLSFYDFMRRDALTHFDTSDYPQDNVCAIPLVNAKVPGLMKDEVKFKIIKEWISLRAKVYSMVVVDNMSCRTAEQSESKTVRKIKGVGRCASKNVTFQDFYNCLFKNESLKASFNTIQSKNHKLYSININKFALVNSDDKRYTCDDGINTLAWGHYSLKPNAVS